MARTIRISVMVGLLAALIAGTSSVVAHDSDGHSGHSREVIETRLVGLPQSFVNVFLAGVKGAGHAWAIKDGEAELRSDGQLDLKVRGLVLSPEGNNPADFGIAIVSCNGGLTAADIVKSTPVPFSDAGNARVKQTLTLPAQCLAPTIFFGSTGGSWFAVSG